MIRPRRVWPLYEKFLRNVAGLGKLREDAGHTRRYDVEHRRARVLVVGGGRAGRAAALAAATEGPGVVLVDENARAAGARARGRRGARAGARARNLGGQPRPGGLRGRALPLPGGAHRRRDRLARAAAPLPRERPRGRDAPRRGPAPRPRLRDQAGRASGRPRCGRARARGRRRAPRRGSRGRRVVDLRDQPLGRIEAHGKKGRVDGVVLDGHASRVRPRRRLGRPAALVLAARPGGRARRVRPGARDLRPTDLPAGVEAVGLRHGRAAARPSTRSARSRRRLCRQVLRLRLRGRDHEGRVPRGRGGLRLDRAREALHDRDDGAVPGEALPAPLDPAVRARDGRERGRGRHDDRAAAVGAGRARAPRRPPLRAGAPHVDPLPSRGGGRADDVGRPVEAPVGVQRQAGGRGPRGARVARGDRRLDAREDPRRGPRGRRAARAPLPEPLRRPAAGPDPLRRADHRRRPDHGRRHGRAARRRPLLRHDDVHGRRFGHRLVRVVERDLALRRRDRERDGRARGGRTSPGRARARRSSGSPRTTSSGRTTSSTWTRSRSRSRGFPASRSGSASSASSATSSTSRARPASSSGTGSSRPARGRSGSSRSASSVSRRGTSSSARTRTPSRTCSPRTCTGCRSSTRTTSWARTPSGTSPSATGASSSSASRWRTDVVPDEGAQIVIEGRPAGRVTSARRSEAVGAVIGLAWLPPERDRGRDALRGARRPAPRRRPRHVGRVLRPGRGADALVSGCDFLSPSRCAPGTTTSRRSAAR